MSTRRFVAILVCGAALALAVAAPSAMAQSPNPPPACVVTSAGPTCPSGPPVCVVTSAGVTCPPDCTITSAGPSCPAVQVPPAASEPSPPPPPQQAVVPVQVRRAVALLEGPRGCVVGRRYTIVVKGEPIVRVTFRVNGKRVRTLRAGSGQRRFSIVLRVTKRRWLVTVRVRFADDARPQAMTLRKSIHRCGR
jgi:hypothetical protein